MRSSLEHYCGFTRSTDDLLTFEIRGPVLATVIAAIWLGVACGVGLGVSQGSTRPPTDLSWIAPSAPPQRGGEATALVLSTGGDGRLRYLPLEAMARETESVGRIALR